MMISQERVRPPSLTGVTVFSLTEDLLTEVLNLLRAAATRGWVGDPYHWAARTPTRSHEPAGVVLD